MPPLYKMVIRKKVTVTFYPDADPETSSVDGNTWQSEPGGVTWATLRAAAGNWADDSTDTLYLEFGSHSDTNKWRKIGRPIIVFDIDAIPSGAVIVKATLSPYLNTKVDGLGLAANFKAQVYATSPASDTGLSPGDYNSFGLDEWAKTELAWNDAITGQYNDIVLNALARSAIQATLSGDKKVRLGLREKYYDKDGNTPTWSYDPADWEQQMRFKSADSGAATAPKLTIEYRY